VGTLLVLAGPKAVGKSWVAEIAEREFDVHYVDADLIIQALLKAGSSPDPDDGWLEPVRAAVFDALARHPAVSVEITGGWESDYKLIRSAEDRGHRVLRVWISAPLDESLKRLGARRTKKVPVSEADARAEYARAISRAAREQWDARFDTSGDEQPDAAASLLRQLLDARP
jgi:shikimate kinase